MAFQVFRAIVKGRIAGAVATRNMFVAEIDLVLPDTVEYVWKQYLNTMMDDFGTILSSVWTAESIQVQLRVGSVWQDVDEYPWTAVGQGSGDALANLVAAVMIGKTQGHRAVGRKFWSPITEAAVNGNSLVTSAAAAFAAGVVDYISPLTTASGSILQPGILDKSGTFKFFTSGFASALLGTIRRRKPGRGT